MVPNSHPNPIPIPSQSLPYPFCIRSLSHPSTLIPHSSGPTRTQKNGKQWNKRTKQIKRYIPPLPLQGCGDCQHRVAGGAGNMVERCIKRHRATFGGGGGFREKPVQKTRCQTPYKQVWVWRGILALKERYKWGRGTNKTRPGQRENIAQMR